MLSLRIPIGAVFVFGLLQVVSAHPSDGYEPRPLSNTFGLEGYGLPIEWEINDLDFVQTYPAPGTMTPEEMYMIGGCPRGPEGKPLAPWYSVVKNEAQRFYYKFGYIPEQLTPDVIAAAWGLPEDEIYPWVMEQIVSPITGDYPYLNHQHFSPGNLYFRTLTDAEKWHIASFSPDNYMLWFEGTAAPSPFDRAAGIKEREPVEVMGVFYLRLYGYNDVITTGVLTGMRPE